MYLVTLLSHRRKVLKLIHPCFYEEPCLRTKYIESNIEEGINEKNQIRVKNSPVESTDAVCQSFVDSGLKHPSILGNIALVEFNDKYLDDVRFVKVSNMPVVEEHITAKYYVNFPKV